MRESHHRLVGLDSGNNGLESFLLLPLSKVGVDVRDEGIDFFILEKEEKEMYTNES